MIETKNLKGRVNYEAEVHVGVRSHIPVMDSQQLGTESRAPSDS